VAEPPDDADLGGPDLARETLRAARAAAQQRARSAGRPRSAAQPGRAASSTAPGDDPVAFGAAIQRLLDERGWQREAAGAGLLARWEQAVGAEIADHCRPLSLTRGVLVLQAESTAWASQLRLLQSSLLARLEQVTGAGVVQRIVVQGPGGGPPSPGRWRVPGSRGPRDTYG
jgi:predicted nucleic acid-binding Zn ribbon protein